MPHPDSTPGFRFKEGKLYIFQPQMVMLIHGWPKLEAVCMRKEDVLWKDFQPDFRLVAPYRPVKRKTVPVPQMELPLAPVPTLLSLPEKRKRVFDAFRFAMPKEIAACTEPFRALQWRLLLLFRTESLALEVCRSNPALVFCLANANILAEKRSLAHIDFAAREVLRKQRDIMPTFGLPGTPAAVKATARILRESVSYESMMQWRKLLADESAARMLAHLPRINAGVIALLSDPKLRAMITPTCWMKSLSHRSRNTEALPPRDSKTFSICVTSSGRGRTRQNTRASNR